MEQFLLKLIQVELAQFPQEVPSIQAMSRKDFDLGRIGPVIGEVSLGRGENMGFMDHISIDPNVCHGRAFSTILDCLAEGMSQPEILRDYPSLAFLGEMGDIRGATVIVEETRVRIRGLTDVLADG